MESDPVDQASLAALRRCFMVLCLDLDGTPPDVATAGIRVQIGNPANRWYIASAQLVVFGNAKAGILCSFPAYLDGNVMMRGATEIQQRALAVPVGDVGGPSELLEHRALPWRAATRSSRLARRAWKDVRRVEDHQQATFTLGGKGRAAFESRGLDPVNTFVIALAIATRRMLGKLPNILQLVTVSKYRCVPVGGAVVTTPELLRAVEYMVDGGGPAALGLLRASLESQVREVRAERAGLSLRWPIEGYVRSRRGLQRVLVSGVLASALAALAASRSLPGRPIVISHPEIVPGVPLVGRPGVRLPYVRHYGLHYQMFRDETVVTFMPGLRWRIGNARMAEALDRALADLLALAPADSHD